MKTKNFLAFDIGASNGRGLIGFFDGKKLKLDELTRFHNESINIAGSLYWDVLSIFSNIKCGISGYVKNHGKNLESIGIDTWGIDYGFIDKSGQLLGNPYCYRDKRNFGLDEKIKKIIGGYRIYKTTGTRIASISTICQLYSDVQKRPQYLETADIFLMMPCLLNYFLTGRKVNEHSIITPTSLFDIDKNKPAKDFFEKLNIPVRIMTDVVLPGTRIGKLTDTICKETGIGNINVIAPAAHDTASAVISVPARNEEEVFFISCGTWSIVGTETQKPVTDEESYNIGITNASTSRNRFMTILNIQGLWLLQECKRVWDKDRRLNWQDIIKLAKSVKPFKAFIDVDDMRFTKSDNMVKEIIAYCKHTHQKKIDGIGEIARVIFESLALKYKDAIFKIETATGKKVKLVHLIGGGAKNQLLCQFTADALGIPVAGGPFEATALGNIIMQMFGSGIIGSVSEGREIIRDSVNPVEYHPENVDMWNNAYSEYKNAI